MRVATLILFTLLAVASAKPGILSAPLIAALAPTAAVGPDGRVLDTPEVAVARAEHAAAHVNERLKLANEAARSGSVQLQAVVSQSSLVAPVVAGNAVLLPGAPVGPDGRVVDTAEVAVAKAAHAAAQVNERINLANEAARSGSLVAIPNETLLPVVATNGVHGGLVPAASIGPDGRVQETPEVAAARAAHAAAQVNERINLANEAARTGGIVASGDAVIPLLANRVVIPGAAVGPDGRVRDTPEVAVAKAAHAAAHINEKLNLANEAVKSADVLAVAGPALAYGRLVY